VRVGSKNCSIVHYLLGDVWKCDDGQTVSSSATLLKNERIWIDLGTVPLTISGTYEYYTLGFCGKAACGQGTLASPVSGADRCSFSVSQGIIYSQMGQQLGTSYVVPDKTCVLSWPAGSRHICGNLEEQCSSDNDCSGHAYGNKECNARTLQTYGCNSLSLPSGITSQNGIYQLDNLPSITSDPGNVIKSKCELKSTIQVQCCGDTDCGTNMFCDNNPSSPTAWTCQNKVQCKKDVDCGTSVQCDWTTNNLKTPSCENGQCTFKEQKVDCCLDKNCDEGSFCNANHKCEVGLGHDINAANSNASTINGNLSPSLSGNSSTGTTILVIFLIIIGGSIGFFVYVKNKKNKSSHKEIKEEKSKEIKSSEKHCTKCGHPLKKGSKFCTKCGNSHKK